jgi:hypothetical protein
MNNLTTTDDNDIIFMMDAMDIWLQQSPLALLRRYEELNGTGVVVGGDVGCYPNDWESESSRWTFSVASRFSLNSCV